MQLGSKLKEQALPSDIVLKPGYKIGKTSTSETSFNRAATIGDAGTGSTKACQMVCVHPKVKLDAAIGKTCVQKVLFISKNKLTLYYTTSLSVPNIKSENKTIPSNNVSYFSKILREAYLAKSSVENAGHIRDHFADDNFHTKIKEAGIKNWEVMTNNRDFDYNCLGTTTDEYDYYGIFVFIGQGVER
ncbi:MAG: hypothetical protein Q4G09_04425 [Clostridia bacterium]|nr:hypothetical protein [Clostridia bacterium]